MNTYWTRPDLDDEWESFEQADAYLQAEFERKCYEDDTGYREDEIEVVLYDFENDKVIDRREVLVVYEGDEPTDRQEHCTYWGRP